MIERRKETSMVKKALKDAGIKELHHLVQTGEYNIDERWKA